MAMTLPSVVLRHIERVRNKAWRKLIARRTYALEDGALLHVGDLKSDELVVGKKPLVVTGDVVVRGIVRDRYRADESLLIVLGDLEADRLVTGGGIFVAGNAAIHGLVYGASSHDDMLVVGGDLAASAIVDGDHHVEVFGTMKVEMVVGSRDDGIGLRARRGKPGRIVEPSEGLVAKALDGESIDRVRAWKLAASDKPLLADPSRAPTISSAPVRTKKLDLMARGLRSVPASVLSNKAVTDLDLSTNELSRLPDALCALPELRVLQLRYLPKLKKLPAAFARMTALRELQLDAQGFRQLPGVVIQLPNLRRLEWWCAPSPASIASVLAAIPRIPALEELTLASLESKLPADLSALRRLKKVEVWSYSWGPQLSAGDLARLKKLLGSKLTLSTPA